MIHRNVARTCSVNANSDLNKKALEVADRIIMLAAEKGFFTCFLDFKKDCGYEGSATGGNLKSIFHSFFEELEKNAFQYELRSTAILISWRFEE